MSVLLSTASGHGSEKQDMRRIISLVIASLMVGVGSATLIYLLEVGGWRGWMLMAAGLVFAAGVVWLYDDLRASDL
jgi:hypothetical protein